MRKTTTKSYLFDTNINKILNTIWKNQESIKELRSNDSIKTYQFIDTLILSAQGCIGMDRGSHN